MLKMIREIFWPKLEKETTNEIEKSSAKQVVQIDRIRSLQFDDGVEAALAVAEKIYSEENERSKTADNKAFQYLLVAAAIISLLTYFESSIWDGKLGTAPKWLSLLLLFIAVAYLVRAALWALKAVSSRVYHIVGVPDVVEIWSKRLPSATLVQEVLIATLKNQDGINAKVSYVIMATAFLSRTIVAFGVLLFVQISWEIFGSLLPFLIPYFRKLVCGIGFA